MCMMSTINKKIIAFPQETYTLHFFSIKKNLISKAGLFYKVKMFIIRIFKEEKKTVLRYSYTLKSKNNKKETKVRVSIMD